MGLAALVVHDHLSPLSLGQVVGLHRLVSSALDNLLLCLDLGELHLLTLDLNVLFAQGCLQLDEVRLGLLDGACIHLTLLL